MALPDFFSNKTATEEEKTAIDAPALSTTKVIGTIGTVIGLIGAAGGKVHGPTAVKVAAIGGGALVILGVFGIIAVDMIVRQRAEAAKLRWGSESEPAAGAAKGSRAAENGEAIEVRIDQKDGDQVTVTAGGDGRTKATIQRQS